MQSSTSSACEPIAANAASRGRHLANVVHTYRLVFESVQVTHTTLLSHSTAPQEMNQEPVGWMTGMLLLSALHLCLSKPAES